MTSCAQSVERGKSPLEHKNYVFGVYELNYYYCYDLVIACKSKASRRGRSLASRGKPPVSGLPGRKCVTGRLMHHNLGHGFPFFLAFDPGKYLKSGEGPAS